MSNFLIKPQDIDTSDRFWDTFGKVETEISARYLVKLAQKKGGWDPFTKEEINAFSGEDFWFNGLVSSADPEHSLIQEREGRYHFTHNFIVQCFLKRPAQNARFQTAS